MISNQSDNVFIAFVLTSLFFASIHCLTGPGFMLYIFLGTFILSFVYWKFENIYLCILMHAANTLSGEIAIPLQEKRGKEEDNNDSVLFRDGYEKEDEILINDLFGSSLQHRFRAAEQMYEEAGLNVKFVSYPGVGHAVSPEMQEDIVEFFLKH